MAEKTVSKHLINLEKHFAASNPVLQKATKVFHELDQLEFDLGLLDKDETTARKSSWWPIISTLGGHSPAKNDFINRYLGVQLHSTGHKFTVLQYTPQTTTATLPGSALDADHRLPFYQVSRDIEQVAKGEGAKINAYLELVTVNSDKLRGKLLVDAPILSSQSDNKINTLLNRHVIEMSDLVLVFTDLFDAEPELINDTISTIIAHQDSNKFLYVIDHSEISLDFRKINEITTSWRRRLAELGINTGQFLVLTDANDTSTIDRRIANIDNDRSYRVLSSLEKSIRDIDDVIIPEVGDALSSWKERSNASTLIVLGFLVTLMLFAEISVGILDFFLDPIIGPIILLILIAILTPMHLIISRVHAKFIVNKLHDRQKKLNLAENLAGLFEKSLTFWRTLLPMKEPVAKNKKTRAKLAQLLEQTKDLVQALNDQFSHYQDDSFNDYSISSDNQ
ncbi:P-loop NTPase family protein [Methylomarinum vadi]|uniref:hypothetical protein n=1 Tax=Methylomarinum vadi TaxID=438855 RepID=UPI0004DFC4CB|nr:hypothetical protein [Methylomarinum vadi]